MVWFVGLYSGFGHDSRSLGWFASVSLYQFGLASVCLYMWGLVSALLIGWLRCLVGWGGARVLLELVTGFGARLS